MCNTFGEIEVFDEINNAAFVAITYFELFALFGDMASALVTKRDG